MSELNTKGETTMAYVAYYRVSTKKQGESGLGLDSQREIIRHFYSNIVAEYIEVKSGKNTTKRPILEQAIAECVAHGHTLVVSKIDRLSRNTEDALSIYNRLNKRLVSCDAPQVDERYISRCMAVAQHETKLVSERTKAAMKQAKKRGTKLGTPENLTSEARKAGNETMKQKAKDAYNLSYDYIKTLRDSGQTLAQISERLNEEGHTTRNDKPFQPMTVKRILDRGAS